MSETRAHQQRATNSAANASRHFDADAHDRVSHASVKELGRMLRTGDLSSLELTRIVARRLATLGPKWNAVAQMTTELGERQARQADRRLRARSDESAVLGIPYGVKDVLATAGIPTRLGSRAFRRQVFSYDATVVERLRIAGAALVAKLAMVEFSGAGGYRYASASADGPGLNPWQVDRWSGGSSSGSASAVAARLIPFALGGETIGSILIPAAFCGVTGFRPSTGAVSLNGAVGLAWSMDKIGPMARSAHDCALVFAAIAGLDPRDPLTREWKPRPARRSRLRIGVPHLDQGTPSSTGTAFEAAVDVFRRIGVNVLRVRIPDHDYLGISLTVLAAETATTHERFLRSRRLGLLKDEAQQRGLRAFLATTVHSYARANHQRALAASDLRTLFREVDAIVLPTLSDEAPKLDADLRSDLAIGHGPALGSIGGLPGLSVPMGFGAAGLPLGLSILCDVGADALVLRIGELFQRETDWHEAIPRHELTAG